MKSSFVKLFFILSITGCDVPGQLLVENHTDAELEYIVEFTSDQSRSIHLKVPSQAERGKLLGFGNHWTDQKILEYSLSIEKIEIIKTPDTMRFDSQFEIERFLRKNRKGIFHQTMKIKL